MSWICWFIWFVITHARGAQLPTYIDLHSDQAHQVSHTIAHHYNGRH